MNSIFNQLGPKQQKHINTDHSAFGQIDRTRMARSVSHEIMNKLKSRNNNVSIWVGVTTNGTNNNKNGIFHKRGNHTTEAIMMNDSLSQYSASPHLKSIQNECCS